MDNPDDANDEKMPFTAHLEELRFRLIRIIAAVGIGFVVSYTFKERLFKVITKPLSSVLPPNSFMIYTGMPEAFFIYMEIAFFASLFLTSPYILYQIWKFVSPGLYSREKKYVLPFVFSSTTLFAGGVLFGYFIVLPPAFKFFVSFSSDFLKPMFSFKEYLSLSLKFLLGFGISFQLPVFLFFMTKIGIVNSRLLSKQRRYAILMIFIVAAVLTPTPDPFNQFLMALPLMLLYEVGIIVARIAERKPSPADNDGDEDKKEKKV
ncbi:MAG TPA: twin-arginine translocase subunit TatC [Syntrophales bacterium]|nr:twin-arginine translocase subunit TatC [Syntrophales bacterium]